MSAQNPVITISSSSVNSSQAHPTALTHRLATQSAADALQHNGGPAKAAVSSGIKYLDNALTGNNPSANAGFERGKIAEIWGPAGSGKTAIAFQSAIEAIKSGDEVTWIDCATQLSVPKLNAFDHVELPEGRTTERVLSGSFHHLSVATFSHLLALVVRPPASFPPSGTTLMVVDGVHALLNLDYPRMPYASGNKTEQQKWQAGRRYAILGTLVTALSRLAMLHGMAVIVTTGCGIKMRADDGLAAAIGPGVGGAEWEAGIWSRIVVFRDFVGRFAGVQKCQGRNLMPLDPTSDVRNAIGFEITKGGLLQPKHTTVDLTSSSPVLVVARQPKKSSSPIKPARKRFYEEIADSDEDADEYGWAEADESAIVAESEGVKVQKTDGSTAEVELNGDAT
ncbi:Putative DNA recombination and repair protein Rad51 [Septoria linicola]|uniref:DNA recombination and repair protein Rad51 n=1 Tax=Septoria linicola TaxID=215465 RepID=A0A9Q9EKG8_9PEZI|nr:Putative DNA recombination and repair protein Rad51 [Septoria linicola]